GAGARPGHGPNDTTRDYALDGTRGRRYLPSPRAGVRLRAATGLVAPSGLFAPIAHSSVVRVPPAEPAPFEPEVVEWVEVRPLEPFARVTEPIPPEVVRQVPPSEAPRVAVAGEGVTTGFGPGGEPLYDEQGHRIGPPGHG